MSARTATGVVSSSSTLTVARLKHFCSGSGEAFWRLQVMGACPEVVSDRIFSEFI
jgi:hypothetical protein